MNPTKWSRVVIIELGKKNPVIVTLTVNLDDAVEGIIQHLDTLANNVVPHLVYMFTRISRKISPNGWSGGQMNWLLGIQSGGRKASGTTGKDSVEGNWKREEGRAIFWNGSIVIHVRVNLIDTLMFIRGDYLVFVVKIASGNCIWISRKEWVVAKRARLVRFESSQN